MSVVNVTDGATNTVESTAKAGALGGASAVKRGSAYVGETTVHVDLRTLEGSAPVAGEATLVLDSKTHQLTVVARIHGIRPGNPYALALSDTAGAKLCDLAPISIADSGPVDAKPRRASASASSTTVIRNVTAIRPGWQGVVDRER